MVSFNCDVCQDVVKKPKLDAHSYRCHGSFTCVDCSKTFNVPADWKSHTSCISEAQKYQKGLYKGKKTKQNGSNVPGGRQLSELENKTNNKPVEKQTQDMALVKVSAQDAASALGKLTTETTQPKEKGKAKTKKRKAKESEDEAADEAPSKEESKKRKKNRQMDVEDDDEAKTKESGTDGTDGKQAKERGVPSSPGADPGDSEEGKSKKEKKDKKKKKANKSLLGGSAVDQAGASLQADTRYQVDTTKKDEEAPESKTDKVAESKKVYFLHSGENAADGKTGKKKKKKALKENGNREKERGEHDTAKERDAAQDNQDNQGKKRKRSDTKDDNVNKNQAIKAKKDKKKRRKSEAVDQKADAA